MTNYHEERKKLLLHLKEETWNQLAAVKTEDPDQFLKSTDMCNKYIDIMNELDLFVSPGPKILSQEQKEILNEIVQVRNEISALIPQLEAKLKQRLAVEKKATNFTRKLYKSEGLPLPSIFLDKKI